MEISAPALLDGPASPLVIAPARRRSRQWLRVLSPLVLLVSWQVGCSSGFISSRTLAAPSQVIASFITLTADGSLQHHLLVSLIRVVKGMCIAVLVGGGLALLSGLARAGEYVIDAPMQMLRTLPGLALIPFFILWFGGAAQERDFLARSANQGGRAGRTAVTSYVTEYRGMDVKELLSSVRRIQAPSRGAEGLGFPIALRRCLV
jgi:hypothetical protein